MRNSKRNFSRNEALRVDLDLLHHSPQETSYEFEIEPRCYKSKLTIHSKTKAADTSYTGTKFINQFHYHLFYL